MCSQVGDHRTLRCLRSCQLDCTGAVCQWPSLSTVSSLLCSLPIRPERLKTVPKIKQPVNDEVKIGTQGCLSSASDTISFCVHCGCVCVCVFLK